MIERSKTGRAKKKPKAAKVSRKAKKPAKPLRAKVATYGPEEARIRRAVAYVTKVHGEPISARAGVVLGSGLGAALSGMEIETAIPFGDIPGFLPSTVEGHAGRLLIGTLSGVPVLVMQGRVHLYEGHPPQDVVLPVRVLIALGAKALVITNAAGGVNPEFRGGDLMLLTDHLNLSGRNPLTGKNEAPLGPRFPDMSEPYAAVFRALARDAAAKLGFELREGVYAGLLGPSYETPAEVRMLHRMGADAVGMSTVLEVIAARHMGARVLGISCISNQAAGLSPVPLTHEEVTATAKGIEARLFGLVAEVLPQMITA